MRWALHVPAFLLVAATAIPLLRGSEWYIRIFDFPRLQVAVAAGVLLVLYLLIQRVWVPLDVGVVTALAIAFVMQVYQIVPYTAFGHKQVAGCDKLAEVLSLFNGNVFMQNRNAEGYLKLILDHDPDAVLLIETDSWWDGAVSELAERYPFSVRVPQDNTYGMILYSRLEIVDHEIRHLADHDVPSIFARLRLRSGQVINLVCLHPRPPRPDKQQDSSERDVELILAAGLVRDMSGPVVVIGDLNDVAWSRTTRLFQKISELGDPRRGRGLYSTFHATYPFLRWPLDHIFLSSDFGSRRIVRLPNSGSDHFPIVYELCPKDSEASIPPDR